MHVGVASRNGARRLVRDVGDHLVVPSPITSMMVLAPASATNVRTRPVNQSLRDEHSIGVGVGKVIGEQRRVVPSELVHLIADVAEVGRRTGAAVQPEQVTDLGGADGPPDVLSTPSCDSLMIMRTWQPSRPRPGKPNVDAWTFPWSSGPWCPKPNPRLQPSPRALMPSGPSTSGGAEGSSDAKSDSKLVLQLGCVDPRVLADASRVRETGRASSGDAGLGHVHVPASVEGDATRRVEVRDHCGDGRPGGGAAATLNVPVTAMAPTTQNPTNDPSDTRSSLRIRPSLGSR